MKNEKTIVVVGGGYAGINLLEALKKEFHKELKRNIRMILVDKNTFHFKKVKLFKGIVNENVTDLHVPLKHYCGSVIEFIQGELTAVNPKEQTVHITREDGTLIHLDFDRLVLAMGSVLLEVDSERGGISLNSLESAKWIRQHLLGNMDSPKSELRLAIAGGGITGIETAAEVGSWLKDNKTEKSGNKLKNIEIFLINDKQRLLEEAPVKISERLEKRLMRQGIHLIHNKKAENFIDGKVFFTDKSELEADVCIWTVGLKPHPSLIDLGLSLTEEGKIKVDSWYRLVDSENIYAIGDCVHVVDPKSGTAAAMSCKEAISQAQRLAKIMKAHIQGYQANSHQTYPDLLCIGLGPNDGFVWAQKWGVDFVLSGKLAERLREYTWNIASFAH
ncbi:FAD-dependent oxidoreductase [Neobacillus sp. PS3-34]|uniref:NAD(P)/FAD-dependent oxidoreductase n=1 Tax=Neobacillus sp. PS3-34 TaxID=3070678 RepID=UPI0027E0BBF0|nr:FAD-dependent oxidoreductase [Neobacillus sp. PS3-34]WML48707.1 FAD-dependent oxidoreductase [Neobacillus sp. PS3-34]